MIVLTQAKYDNPKIVYFDPYNLNNNDFLGKKSKLEFTKKVSQNLLFEFILFKSFFTYLFK